jgi:hypothetical protein
MRMLMRALTEISKISDVNSAEWLSSAENSVEFLKESVKSERLVLFASLPAVYIHGVLVPLRNLNPPDQIELSADFVTLGDSWIIEHVTGGGKPDRVYLEPPLATAGKSLKRGEKLIFMRSFAGRVTTPIEISQKLVHALDLHFIHEKNAYCRLDENGDLEEVISIIEQSSSDWTKHITVVAILAKEFAEYMRLSNMGLVIFFDFTRTPRNFSRWSEQRRFDHKARDLFYDGGVMPGHASYVNGRMIVRPTITRRQIVRTRMEARSGANRQYALFKAIDLKTGNRLEV